MQKRNFLKRSTHIWTIVLLIVYLIVSGCQSDSKQSDKDSSGKKSDSQKSSQAEPVDYAKLVGRWLRPDGGYIIEIQKVDINGQMQAAYYNPRSINVSQALAAQKEGII